MRISDKGKITWKPPRTIQSVEEKVIVTIRDAAEQEMFHTFSIEIPSVKELAAAKQKAAKAKRKAEVQARRQLAAEQKAAAFEQRLAAKEIAAAEARKKILTRVRNSTNSGTAAEGIASSKTKSALPVEAWTDTTGKHTMSARFASVQDESKVVLELENGTTKTIPLEKLTAKHIYRAVRYDLEQRGKLEKNSPSSKSPFEDGGGNSTVTANPVDDQLLVEIVKDVERMIKITKTEKDNVKFLRGILFPPELAKKMERDEGLKKFKARFSENDRQKVLDGLLSIDFLKLNLVDGIASFGSPTPRLQKHEGTWYLKN